MNDQIEKIRKIMGGAPKWVLEVRLNFGKYKDEILGDIFAVDKSYLCWLEYQPFLNAETKKAVTLVLESK